MSGCFGSVLVQCCTVAPTRREELEQVVSRLCGICNDFLCLFPDCEVVQVLDAGHIDANDPFCIPDCPLLSTKPDTDGCAESRFNDCTVELNQPFLR